MTRFLDPVPPDEPAREQRLSVACTLHKGKPWLRFCLEEPDAPVYRCKTCGALTVREVRRSGDILVCRHERRHDGLRANRVRVQWYFRASLKPSTTYPALLFEGAWVDDEPVHRLSTSQPKCATHVRPALKLIYDWVLPGERERQKALKVMGQ